jgi:pyridoxamine 5'-phosphate oxidase-like protein
MLFDEGVLRQLEPGTSILVGTVDPSGWPSCCRGVALVVHPDREGVTVYVPVATAAETVANIASNGQVAVVASEIVSHVSVQLKGRARAVRVAGEDEAEAVHGHFDRFIGVLDSVGLPRGISRTMTRWPAFAVDVAVEAIFEQTPGPRAGALVKSR